MNPQQTPPPTTSPADALQTSIESGLRDAAAQIQTLFSSVNARALTAELESDLNRYARLVNALAKLNDAALKRDLHRVQLLEREARLQAQSTPAQPGGIRPETLKRIEEELGLL